MKQLLSVVLALALWPAMAQAQTFDEAMAQLDQREFELSESLAAEVRAMAEDQAYECNAFVAAVAQGVAIRSGGTNLVADAVGSYCAGAEVATWLREWYARALEQMMWIRVAMALNWQLHYGGWLWQYFV